ncbi:MAG: Gfo/Idh/MocA family oxidoreductase [Planctomycetia bacterium]|nr:Gfo/Idh/MocA family oxidoreductase [Planctomycetia bacterium]
MRRGTTTRRTFLKTTAGAAAVVAAGLASAPRVHAEGSDLLKIGIIGCGGRGMGAVRNNFDAVENTQLVAMGDMFEDRAKNAQGAIKEAMGDRVDVPDSRVFHGFDNYKGVIEASDVVLIACASRFHPFYTKTAVEAGKHVFCEKPHGIDSLGVHVTLEAAELAAEKGTALVSGLCYRYDTLRREAVEQIRNGLIGDVNAIQCDYVRSPYSMLKRVEGWSELEYQFRNWYHFTWLSGDEIMQSLLHNLDSMLWILNEETPVSCYGIGGRSAMYVPEYGDWFDHTAVIYDFADGKRIYGMTRGVDKCYYSNMDVIHGTKGRCVYHATDTPYITDLAGKEIWRPAAPRQRDMYVQEHYDMINSIMSGTPINDGQRMAKTTMVAVLGMIASRNGQQVSYQELFDSGFTFGPAEDAFKPDMTPPVAPEENGLYPVAKPGTTVY